MPARRLEAERAEQPAGVGHPRRDDVAVADADAVAQHLLEHHFDRVAGLQVAVEVDVAAEQLGDRHGEADVLAGPIERGDQRRMVAVDVAADRHQRRFAPVGHDLGGEPGRGAGLAAPRGLARRSAGVGRRDGGQHLQEPIGVDAVGQLADAAVRAERQRVGVAGAELARAERRFDDVEERLAIAGGDLMALEQRGERLARPDRALDPPPVVRAARCP